VRVCQLATADVWAGVETQIATVTSDLVTRADFELSAFLFNDGRLARELKCLGIPVTIVDESRHSAPALLLSLVRFLREHKIDLIHTHGYKENVLGSLAATLAGVPHVVRTVHGLAEPLRGFAHAKMRAYQAMDRTVVRWTADAVIAVSTRMERDLTAAGYPPAAMTLVYNGVNLEKVRATRTRGEVRRELGIDRDAVVIGTVGRLTAVKGHELLLRAAPAILRRESGATFVFVGTGPLRDVLGSLATARGIAHAVRWPGAREDVYDLLSAMDIFVLPSLDEGTPMSILEAMAFSRPIVATRVGGLPEIIEHGVTGLLVPSHSVEALVDACVELARDPTRARALGTRARQVVENRFSHSANARALTEIYLRVGHKRGSSLSDPVRRWLTPISGPVRRILTHPSERIRLHRLRRNRTRAIAALRCAQRVLIICHGNIIRSPFACRRLQQALGTKRHVTVASAGLEAKAGQPPHETALRRADSLRVNLADHRAAPITRDEVAASDVIFVMEVGHLVEMRRRYPDSHRKTFLLTSLAPDTPLDIADPYGRDESVFDMCFAQISRAVDPIAVALAGPVTR
jgi:glycosyltransferase involved in cell wall biosynthesis/protein-tyrosine-phosphatase